MNRSKEVFKKQIENLLIGKEFPDYYSEKLGAFISFLLKNEGFKEYHVNYIGNAEGCDAAVFRIKVCDYNQTILINIKIPSLLLRNKKEIFQYFGEGFKYIFRSGRKLGYFKKNFEGEEYTYYKVEDGILYREFWWKQDKIAELEEKHKNED